MTVFDTHNGFQLGFQNTNLKSDSLHLITSTQSKYHNHAKEEGGRALPVKAANPESSSPIDKCASGATPHTFILMSTFMHYAREIAGLM